jgi:hypothetical protein
MGDNLVPACIVLAILGGLVGAGYIYISSQSTEVITVNMTITASGELGDVAYGVPERGFWGYENGAIDWESLPVDRRCWNYRDSIEKITFEYWFRERFYNGTEWKYSNHGPFFVDWPQLEYYEEIELNNHTVYIEMKEC